MKYTGILLLFIFWANLLQGQTLSKDVWHEGEVNLFSGETLHGKLRYDLDNDNVQLQTQGILKSFNAFQVESFFFFDQVQKQPRHFYTLPYTKVGKYESPTFFELFTEGEVSLLNREVINYRYLTPTGYWATRVSVGNVAVPEVEDVYYVLVREKVTKLDSPKSQLQELLKDREQEVEQFVQKKRLGYSKRPDLISIVEFYNSFFPNRDAD